MKDELTLSVSVAVGSTIVSFHRNLDLASVDLGISLQQTALLVIPSVHRFDLGRELQYTEFIITVSRSYLDGLQTSHCLY